MCTESKFAMVQLDVTDQEGALQVEASKRDLKTDTLHDEKDLVSINDDVYNMFFLSKFLGQAFFYAVYVFLLKMALFTFLMIDAIDAPFPDDVDTKVVIAQFLMLPVAVSLQSDLIATYFLIANIKYDPLLKPENPNANVIKFYVANICRGIDGLYSLAVNFVILLKAETVLSLFLNFAALQFLQHIDDLALEMAAKGYLSSRLEEVALRVQNAKLPRRHHKILNLMDTVLFLSTFFALIVAWAYARYG